MLKYGDQVHGWTDEVNAPRASRLVACWMGQPDRGPMERECRPDRHVPVARDLVRKRCNGRRRVRSPDTLAGLDSVLPIGGLLDPRGPFRTAAAMRAHGSSPGRRAAPFGASRCATRRAAAAARGSPEEVSETERLDMSIGATTHEVGRAGDQRHGRRQPHHSNLCDITPAAHWTLLTGIMPDSPGPVHATPFLLRNPRGRGSPDALISGRRPHPPAGSAEPGRRVSSVPGCAAPRQ
jgi:hypothetical protein